MVTGAAIPSLLPQLTNLRHVPVGAIPGTPGPALGAGPATAAHPEQTGCQNDHHLQATSVITHTLAHTRTPELGDVGAEHSNSA